jgi:intracellular proteinase inhibitor BsuPI
MKFFIALVMLAAIARSACVSDSGGTTDCLAFDTSLTVRDRMSQAEKLFNLEEPITFELLIANTLNEPATLTAGSSCTAVVFEISDSSGRRVWGSADSIACIQMQQPRTFAALETVRESATWDQRGSGGAFVPAGAYTVTAGVGQYAAANGRLTDCRAELGKSTTFRIR